MEFGEMKQNTSNWSNFCMLLRRAGLTASAGLSCYFLLIFSILKLDLLIFVTTSLPDFLRYKYCPPLSLRMSPAKGAKFSISSG